MLRGVDPAKLSSQFFGRPWMMLIIIIAVIAVHGLVLQYIWSHLAVPATVVGGLVALILIKHLGLLAPAYALLRRYPRGGRQ